MQNSYLSYSHVNSINPYQNLIDKHKKNIMKMPHLNKIQTLTEISTKQNLFSTIFEDSKTFHSPKLPRIAIRHRCYS